MVGGREEGVGAVVLGCMELVGGGGGGLWLCTAFKKVLNLEKVGIYDDFYELGGDSLGSIEAILESGLPGLEASMIFRGRTAAGEGEAQEKPLRSRNDISSKGTAHGCRKAK